MINIFNTYIYTEKCIQKYFFCIQCIQKNNFKYYIILIFNI